METKTALMKATDLLARQAHSEAMLRRKLEARRYSREEIDGALEVLKARGYLDDASTCERQFERLYEAGKMSVAAIRAKLMQWGFEAALIDRFVPDDAEEHDRSAALRALRVKFKAAPEDDKMWRYLSGRGFGGDAIAFAVEEFKK